MLTKDMSEATLVIERCVPRLDPSSHLVRARPFTIPRSLRRVRQSIVRFLLIFLLTTHIYIYTIFFSSLYLEIFDTVGTIVIPRLY